MASWGWEYEIQTDERLKAGNDLGKKKLWETIGVNLKPRLRWEKYGGSAYIVIKLNVKQKMISAEAKNKWRLSENV